MDETNLPELAEQVMAQRRKVHRLMTGQPDQVPRKLRYEATHPDVTFEPPCAHDPMWRARCGDTWEMKAIHLVDLLDRLEQLDGPAVPQGRGRGSHG